MRWDDKDSFLYSPQVGLLWAHFLIRSQSWSFSICCCSVAKSCPTLCRPYELQHARLPCPSLSLGACSNSCPESRQCHPTVSSFVAPFPSCTQSFPASGSFPVGQLFASCGQRIRASASVFPMNTQGWFPLGLTDLISLLSKVLSRVFSCTTIWKHKFFSAQPSLWSNSHIHTWLQEKSKQTIALTIWTFVSKMMFLLLNMLSMLDIAFLPRSKRLLISWLQSPSAVILEPKKVKSLTVSMFSHLFAMRLWDWMPWS